MSTKKRHDYRVILFIDQSKNQEKAVDFVPSHWISLDSETLKPVTKFMPPPYTVKKSRWLHKLIKGKENPVDDWPSYPIEVLQNAETYSEAEIKIQNWKGQDYMYTTDCNESDVEEDKECIIDKQKASTRANLPEVSGLDGKLSKCETYSFDTAENSAHEDSSQDERRERNPKSKNKPPKPQKIGIGINYN